MTHPAPTTAMPPHPAATARPATALVVRRAIAGAAAVMYRWLDEHRQLRRTLAGTALAGAVLIGALAPAAAHTALIFIDPADGAHVPDPPTTITLVFSEQMTPDLSTVAVRVDGGPAVRAQVQRGANTSTLIATIPDSLNVAADRAQDWTVVYRVVSRDGHPVTGQSTLRVAATQTPAGDNPSSNPGSNSADSPSESADGARTSKAPAAAGPPSTPAPSNADEEPTSNPGAAETPSGSTGTPWAAVLLAGGTLAVLLVLAVLAAVRLARRTDQ